MFSREVIKNAKEKVTCFLSWFIRQDYKSKIRTMKFLFEMQARSLSTQKEQIQSSCDLQIVSRCIVDSVATSFSWKYEQC